MSYENFGGDEWEGVITGVEVKPLREHIEDSARLAKWGKYDEEARKKAEERGGTYVSAADADHVILYVKPDAGSDYVKDFIVGRNPTSRSAFQRSNVKNIVLANKLPLNTGEWVGLKVRLRSNSEGFPELVK